MSEHYSRNGKRLNIITPEEFARGMNEGYFTFDENKAFCVLLYYSGVRVTEATRVVKEQFQLKDDKLYFDVGPREKTGLRTNPLPLNIHLPFMDLLVAQVEKTEAGKLVFGFTRETARNTVMRVWNNYPHHFRLSRITSMLQQGFNPTQVKSWSGHKQIYGLDPYIGLVDISEIGRNLK